jgi:3-oxoacyl-[acyl-carrier protein] reductase
MPIPAAFDLSGRVAVVTGAGSADGIGFAAARLLAELGAARHSRVIASRPPGQSQAGRRPGRSASAPARELGVSDDRR